MSNDKQDRARIVAPPPLIVLICVALGFVAKRLLVPLPLFVTKTKLQIAIGAALVGVAILVIAMCRRAFVKHGTHVNPYTPTKSIVSAGPYRFSRNPIYIAFVIATLAFTLFANSVWFIGSAVLTLVLLRFGVVNREETYLREKFGAEYEDYCARVRRWI